MTKKRVSIGGTPALLKIGASGWLLPLPLVLLMRGLRTKNLAHEATS